MSASITQRATALPERERRRHASRRRFGAGPVRRRPRRRLRCRRAISPTRGCSSASSCSRRTSTRRRSPPRTRPRRSRGICKRAYFNEQEHYQSVAGILSGAGQTPAVAGDIDFSYPAGTFDSQGSIAKLAQQLENLSLGAYLGAIAGMQTAALTGGLAQIAACEAQHAAYFTTLLGGKTFRSSFPPALTIDQVSNALDTFTA